MYTVYAVMEVPPSSGWFQEILMLLPEITVVGAVGVPGFAAASTNNATDAAL